MEHASANTFAFLSSIHTTECIINILAYGQFIESSDRGDFGREILLALD